MLLLIMKIFIIKLIIKIVIVILIMIIKKISIVKIYMNKWEIINTNGKDFNNDCKRNKFSNKSCK